MDRPVTEGGGGGGMTKNLIPKKSALRKEGLERAEPLNNVDSPLLSAAFSLSHFRINTYRSYMNRMERFCQDLAPVLGN